MTPTARSLESLRKRGCLVAVVEHTIRIPAKPGEPPRIFKRDLFEVFDLLALEPAQPGCLGIQTTTAENLTKRVAKIRDHDPARRWLAAANRIEVHGWSLRGPRGAPKRWGCTVLDLVLADGMIVDVRREGLVPTSVPTPSAVRPSSGRPPAPAARRRPGSPAG